MGWQDFALAMLVAGTLGSAVLVVLAWTLLEMVDAAMMFGKRLAQPHIEDSSEG